MTVGSWKFFERRVIGDMPMPYMVRYILFRCPAFGVMVHRFCRSDYDRALHDHPWPFITWLIGGGYCEIHNQTRDGAEVAVWRSRWSVLVRPAEWRHRVILESDTSGLVHPVWTLVLVGRRCQSWGFYLPTGWCHWRRHNPSNGICETEPIWLDGSD